MALTCGFCGDGSPLPPGFVSLAAVGVTWIAMVWFAGREGLSRRLSLLVGVIGIVGAFLGGHVYVVLESAAGELGKDPWLLLRFWEGSQAVLGAFMGAALSAFAVFAITRRPFLAYADAWAPAVALGYGTARLACFLNGDDFGAVSALPWAVQFPPGSYAQAVHLERGWIEGPAVVTLAVHPTQLYHSLAGFAGAIFMCIASPAWRGGRLAVGMGFYGTTRFMIEFFRDDYVQRGVALDTAHWLSLGLVAVAVLLWWRFATRTKRPAVMAVG